jgi:hypothetical protein
MLLSYETDQITGRYRSRNLTDRYNYFLTGGYLIDLGKGVGLVPSALLKYCYRHTAQADINAQVILQDIVGSDLVTGTRIILSEIFNAS